MKTLLTILGRICLSLIFILSGVGIVTDWQGTEIRLANGLNDLLNYTYQMGHVQNFLHMLLPWVPKLVTAAAVFTLLGGLLLFFGLLVRFAAFLLLLYQIPQIIILHHFWLLTGMEKRPELVLFFNGLALVGGLLYVLALGKGGSSPVKREKSSEK